MVVFDIWHGKKLSTSRLEQMSDYWRNKINRNVTRDVNNNALLVQMGYSVLRFLESEINSNLDLVVAQITQAVKGKQSRQLITKSLSVHLKEDAYII